MTRGLERLSYEDRLRVGVVQSGEEKAPGRPYSPFQYLEVAYRKGGEGSFIRECSDRMRGNGFNLKEDKFRLDIMKQFFIVRVVRHWNKLPREAVDAPSLEVFKARLDGALSNLVWWKVSLPRVGRLEPDDLSGPFQL
ncbi:hypothetical protein llap_8903 [Limosa lapponica baueri]|uniref:Uncharacterized protein n=1 Tax=Limosa lapponica baueri TaxID=1758121 RepID=A0A2I0U440_LIMLA|nr:hypothetical protein llap_8903 [Limosa lapponica baueri]